LIFIGTGYTCIDVGGFIFQNLIADLTGKWKSFFGKRGGEKGEVGKNSNGLQTCEFKNYSIESDVWGFVVCIELRTEKQDPDSSNWENCGKKI